MEHVIDISGGYDYDVYIECSCGADLGRYHSYPDTLTLEFVIGLRDDHLKGVDNGEARG